MKTKYKISIGINFVGSIAIFGSFLSSCLAAVKIESKYMITAEKIGNFPRSKISLNDVKEHYPELEMEIGKGAPGALWRTNVANDDGLLYFIFRDKGEELFRAVCGCWRSDQNGWEDQYGHRNLTLEQFDFIPVVVSDKFQTQKGIHVGNSVSDLIRAYPELHHLTAVLWVQESGPYNTEFVCFDAGISNPGDTSIHSMNFYVKPARGKKLVGTYGNERHTRVIDQHATIVAIQPRGGCLLNSQPE